VTVFDRIYRDNLWNGSESRSGPGSGAAATARLRDRLVALVDELGIESVMDVGCGDNYWMPDLPGYYGFDPSRTAVAFARRNHPQRRFGTHLPAKAFGLVIVRDVVQHLPLTNGVNLIAAVRATGSTWLLASTFVGGENIDIVTGRAYSPDLTAAPFDLGQPARLIFDGYGYEDSDAIRDPRKHLGLWRL
jgi:hypothetical protein